MDEATSALDAESEAIVQEAGSRFWHALSLGIEKSFLSQALDRLVATSGSSVMATSSSWYRSKHSQPQIEFTQQSKYSEPMADRLSKVCRAHQRNSMSR